MKITFEVSEEQAKCNHAFPVERDCCRKCGISVHLWHLMPGGVLEKENDYLEAMKLFAREALDALYSKDKNIFDKVIANPIAKELRAMRVNQD